MKQTVHLLVSSAFALATLCLSGYASAEESGFLSDYSALVRVDNKEGDNLRRYVNPKMKPDAYTAVMLDVTQYYPAPKPTEKVSANTLKDISSYVDRELRDKLGAKVKLVREHGPGVLRMRVAITAVGSDKAGLKAYQLIPLAFIDTTIKGRDQLAQAQIEVDLLDSMTGERMAAAVRSGSGAKLTNANDKLKLTDLSPMLNEWIATGSQLIAEQVRP